MSRMLKALQQIEAKSPPSLPGDTAVQPQPSEAPAADWANEADEPIRNEAAIEAALARVEVAAALAAGVSVRQSSREKQPPAEPEPVADDKTASPRDPARSPTPIIHWPLLPTEEHVRAYGELADAILAKSSPEGWGTLMFTSPGDGEGTTGVLVPLAASLVERLGGGLLAVDGNLRTPALANRLGVQSESGLADVLLGTSSWDRVVRSTVVPGLDVLPGVKFSALGGRLPHELNLDLLLEELCSEYRLVLLDTASLAHREVAPMARHCDGAYLVVRLRHTARRAMGEAVRAIESCRGRVLGSVVIGG